MNRTVKTLAEKVANRTDTASEYRGFKEAMSLLGWEGVRGSGVHNHANGERVKSWATLASLLLLEYGRNRLEAANERDRQESTAEYAAEAEPAPGETAPEFVYLYTTRTPTIVLTERTTVDTLITEEILGVTEGLCESGASLECSLEDPSMGILRVLPESMLPGQERTIMLQCLPCNEASAEAYVRKLHRVAE